MAFGRNTSFVIAAIVSASLASGCVSLGAPHEAGPAMAAAHKTCMERAATDAASSSEPGTDAPSGKCPMMDKTRAASTDEKPEHDR